MVSPAAELADSTRVHTALRRIEKASNLLSVTSALLHTTVIQSIRRLHSCQQVSTCSFTKHPTKHPTKRVQGGQLGTHNL